MTTAMCDKRKKSKTISVIIRNHEYVDGQGYRMTKFGNSNLRDRSLYGTIRQYGTIDRRIFTQMSLEDCISASSREALKKLYVLLSENQITHSIKGEEIQVSHTNVEKVVELKPGNRIKKWLVELGPGGAIIANMITYAFRR